MQNSEAAQAFNSYISSMSPSCSYFRIFIARKYDPHIVEPNLIDRSDFIDWMSNANKKSTDINEFNRQNSINNSQDEAPKSSGNDIPDDLISIASVQQVDPFNRESASRKSFSEKGPFGMRVDPSKFENFKQISHQRQISGKYLTNTVNLLCFYSNKLFEFSKLTFAFKFAYFVSPQFSTHNRPSQTTRLFSKTTLGRYSQK